MATENQSPTNEPIESATQDSHGGDVGGALSESDFIRYFNDKFSNDSSAEAATEQSKDKAEAVAESHDDVVDISELGEDSTDPEAVELDSDSNDTNESEADDSKEEPVFEIQVDGKKFEVKQSELIADAQKYRSSKGKFDTASEMRKEAEEIKASYQHDRDALKQALAQFQNFIATSYKEQEPDWDGLYHNDRLEYFTQKEIWEAKMEQLRQAQAYHAEIRRQEELEAKQSEARILKEQQKKLYELLPTWKNPEVAERDKNRMHAYLTQEGFSEQELDSILDARIVAVVHKAALYDQAVKAKNQKLAKPTTGKTLTAGVSQAADPGYAKRQAQTANAREAKALQDRFKQEGSQDAFVDMFKNQLRNGRK